MDETYVLLCARDPVLVEAVEVAAAAQQVVLRHARDADEARQSWGAASLRLVSTEVAARWSDVPPGSAYLVGTVAAELTRCSAELGLPVLPLPDAGGRLAQALATVRVAGSEQGRTVALLGASGGLGVSTLAVGLALAATRAGSAGAVVDLAPHSGGLDLLLGIESVQGVRWADLARARGELGDLAANLPVADRVPVLTQARDLPRRPTAEAVAAAVASLRRQHGLVVLDCATEPPVFVADDTLLVVGADVRSVAAARMLAEVRGVAPSGLIVRRGAGRTLPSAVVGRSLGAPIVATVDHDKALPRLAELGMVPVGGPARRFTRQITALAAEVCRG